jgi:hypothetical protein
VLVRAAVAMLNFSLRFPSRRNADDYERNPMRIERRLKALEERMLSVLVILTSPTVTKEICGACDFLRARFATYRGAELGPVQTAQLDLIRKSVRAGEPGGGRTIEPLGVFLDSLLAGPRLGHRDG